MPSRNVGGANQGYFGARKRKKDYDAADDYRKKKKNKWDQKQEDMDNENDPHRDVFED